MNTADCAVRRRGILAHSTSEQRTQRNTNRTTHATKHHSETPQASNARITPASANTAQPAKFSVISQAIKVPPRKQHARLNSIAQRIAIPKNCAESGSLLLFILLAVAQEDEHANSNQAHASQREDDHACSTGLWKVEPVVILSRDVSNINSCRSSTCR